MIDTGIPSASHPTFGRGTWRIINNRGPVRRGDQGGLLEGAGEGGQVAEAIERVGDSARIGTLQEGDQLLAAGELAVATGSIIIGLQKAVGTGQDIGGVVGAVASERIRGIASGYIPGDVVPPAHQVCDLRGRETDLSQVGKEGSLLVRNIGPWKVGKRGSSTVIRKRWGVAGHIRIKQASLVIDRVGVASDHGGGIGRTPSQVRVPSGGIRTVARDIDPFRDGVGEGIRRGQIGGAGGILPGDEQWLIPPDLGDGASVPRRGGGEIRGGAVGRGIGGDIRIGGGIGGEEICVSGADLEQILQAVGHGESADCGHCGHRVNDSVRVGVGGVDVIRDAVHHIRRDGRSGDDLLLQVTDDGGGCTTGKDIGCGQSRARLGDLLLKRTLGKEGHEQHQHHDHKGEDNDEGSTTA